MGRKFESIEAVPLLPAPSGWRFAFVVVDSTTDKPVGVRLEDAVAFAWVVDREATGHQEQVGRGRWQLVFCNELGFLNTGQGHTPEPGIVEPHVAAGAPRVLDIGDPATREVRRQIAEAMRDNLGGNEWDWLIDKGAEVI